MLIVSPVMVWLWYQQTFGPDAHPESTVGTIFTYASAIFMWAAYPILMAIGVLVLHRQLRLLRTSVRSSRKARNLRKLLLRLFIHDVLIEWLPTPPETAELGELMLDEVVGPVT